MEISYSYMNEDDIGQAAALEKKYFSQPWSEEGIRHYFENGQTLFIAAKHGKKVAGYAAVLCAADEGNLVSIAVDEDFRNMGIAREILDILYEKLQENDIAKIFLEVRKSNKAAINLYKSEGFEETGTRKGFYEKPKEDAILFMKNI